MTSVLLANGNIEMAYRSSQMRCEGSHENTYTIFHFSRISEVNLDVTHKYKIHNPYPFTLYHGLF